MNTFIKRYKVELIVVITTALMFNIAAFILPPNFRGLSFYTLFFIFDVFISVIFFSISKWQGAKRIIFLILFWSPFTLLCFIVLFGIFFPFPDWNIYTKVIAVALLFALLIAHFILSLFLLITLVLRRLTKSRHLSNSLIYGGMVISLFVFTICAIAPFYWTVSPKIVAVDIKTEKISKGFDGYKIVQLSDMHFDFFIDDKLLQATVDSIEKLQPDVIMITGDIVTYKADELKPFLKTLRQLQAPDGVYFVMGNHDYGSYYRWKTERESLKNDAKLLQYFERLGWKILRNKSDYLICRNDTIAVAGTENKCFHQSHYPCDGDIELALREVPVFYPVIVMTHDPVYWEEELRYNERPLFLTLSGHTHGMQIGYRTKTKQWGLYRVLNKYSNGLYYENEKYLYINSGLGTVGFPFRIGLNPEITLLTLKHPAS